MSDQRYIDHFPTRVIKTNRRYLPLHRYCLYLTHCLRDSIRLHSTASTIRCSRRKDMDNNGDRMYREHSPAKQGFHPVDVPSLLQVWSLLESEEVGARFRSCHEGCGE